MTIELALRFIGGVIAGVGAWDLVLGTSSTAPSTITVLAFGLIVTASFGIGFVVTPYLTTRPFILLLNTVSRSGASDLIVGTGGLLVGLFVGTLLVRPLERLPGLIGIVVPITVSVLGAYLGARAALAHKRDLLALLGTRLGRGGGPASSSDGRVLLDTSVIIDGRISDIARSGFLSGPLLVPRFILAELQRVADSTDTLRRNRGRRGLEILTRLQKDESVMVEIIDEDGDNMTTVDAQLVSVARALGVPIATNDYNLNRVAGLQGVKVLNMNELADAVRTVVLPGEEMRVRIVQEGKEFGQGVGFLDDGTIVVVENGRSLLNDTADVVVTRVLQTTTGRMIFAQSKGVVSVGTGTGPRA